MHHPSLPPRAQRLLARVDAWSSGGPVRAMTVRVGVTVLGPLVVLAGLAMLVLPGPGLVVIALGLALLALEHDWARRLLHLGARGLARARRTALPTGGSRRRRAVGVLATGGVLALTTAATAAATTYLGSVTLL
ncbi:MAG TPA: PGPGW domain-containing protein [Pedococcus sp.]